MPPDPPEAPPDPPAEPTYEPGTQAGLCGCLAGALFVALAAPLFLFVLAWSGAHCEPVPQCQRSAERMLAAHLAAVFALALLFGLAVRALVRWAMLRRFDRAAAGPPPLWAVAAAVLLASVALWLGAPIYFPAR